MYERGGGNPLFSETLPNTDGTVSPDLPWSLRELLLGAVKHLPEQAQQLLRTAPVGRSRVGHALLAAATRCDDAALTAELRPARAANVLVTNTDGYAFRHELIREAVLGDLLLGERAQAHRRFAETLEATPPLDTEGSAAVQVARLAEPCSPVQRVPSIRSVKALGLLQRRSTSRWRTLPVPRS